MYVLRLKKNNIILFLSIIIIILGQGIRTYLNDIIGVNVFNYHVFSLMIIIFLILKNKSINKMNLVLILTITALITINFILLRQNINNFIRSLISFILPLYILLIDIKDLDISYIFRKFILYFNLLIYLSLSLDIFSFLSTGQKFGLLGHSLTSGWYYCIFLVFNYLYCLYFKEKKDIFIFKDILISLIGTVLVTGRISMLSALFLAFIYSKNCIKKRSILCIFFPLFLVFFLSSDFVDNLIWDKFRYAAGWGDITNGRLLGIRQMIIWGIKPNFFYGGGIGYSNYITGYIFNTINFENPILMFSFDYGIFIVILLLLLTLFTPIMIFLKFRNYKLVSVYIIIYLIPYTYNGLAESIGLFIVLMMIVFMFCALNYEINNIRKCGEINE